VNWRAWHLDDNESKASLARLLEESAEAFGVSVFAGVLMSNHVHAVVQSPPPALFRQLTGRRTTCRHFRAWPARHQKSSVIAQFMRVVRRTTSVRRQRVLGLSGRFWEAAYDARPVNNALSLAIRIAYDHRNPVEQGMARRPEHYRWSTAAEWITGAKGEFPLTLPEPLPFGLSADALRELVLGHHKTRLSVEADEELRRLLWAQPEPPLEVLQAFVEKHGLPGLCGTRAANR